MAEQDLDRNEAATPYKLQKAREKGQVSKSTELVSACVFTAAVVYLSALGLRDAVAQFHFDQQLLVMAAQADVAHLFELVARALVATLRLLAPLLLTLVLVAVVANLAQTGPVLSLEPVLFDLDRINPVRGLQRLLSARTLFDAARSCVKLGLLLWVAGLGVRAAMPRAALLAGQGPGAQLRSLVDEIASLGFKLAAVLLLIAAFDFLYTRREFARKMRMSRRELKDEVKHREGDPRIRARMRELRREMRKRSQALRQTRSADVVLTNPTHLAVALRYTHGEMPAPVVVAKGSGLLAAAMRRMAAVAGIPVVRSPALARRLYRELDLDHPVPPHLFADVARIIVWVFAMRDRRLGARATGGAA